MKLLSNDSKVLLFNVFFLFLQISFSLNKKITLMEELNYGLTISPLL